MDQALYDSVTATIFGVRGQWLFQFNATTGAFIRAMRFTVNASCTSCLTILGGRVYCGVSNVAWNNYSGAPSFDRNDLDVFVVDTVSFTLVDRWNSFSNVGKSGFVSLTNNGTLIYGSIQTAVLPNDLLAFVVNPAAPAGLTTHNIGSQPRDLVYDSFNSVIWYADGLAQQFGVEKSDFTNGTTNDTVASPFCGCCYNLAQNKAYFVLGGETFTKINAVDVIPSFTFEAPFTTLHTGQVNANPIRIKSVNGLVGNNHNGKVLIPCWQDDTVIVWNPATDSVDSVQAGFTAPIDVVVTPTKNFAVQSGVTGLREIV